MLLTAINDFLIFYIDTLYTANSRNKSMKVFVCIFCIFVLTRCVMKMDHHCPWINTCCGHLNHGNFCLFLVFAPFGCIHAVCILVPAIYRALNFVSIFYMIHLCIYSRIKCYILILRQIILLASGFLFCIHVLRIAENYTHI